MAKKHVFNVYHDTGEVDNIIDSLVFIIHSEKVDFSKTSMSFDSRYLKGGEKIIAVPIVTHRSEMNGNYPTVTNIKVNGNTVTWAYEHNSGMASATVPIIHVFKLMGR